MKTIKLSTPGPEDLAYVEVADKPSLFTAAVLRRVWRRKWMMKKDGKMFAIDLEEIEKGEEPDPVEWKRVDAEGNELSVADHPFHPLGLCALKRGDKWFLFVVNLTPPGKGVGVAVEEYEVGNGVLILRRRLENPGGSEGKGMRIKHGNNVAVTSSGRVYVSNFKNIGDRKDLPPDLKLRKDAGDRADVYMTRFTDDDESAEWVQVARNISGANGLCLSPDEKQLYVAEYHRGRVLRFDVNADDGSLANPEFLPLSGEKKRYPDNITCDAEGNFALIAQHGKFETLAQGISQTLFKKAESSIHVLDGKTGVFAEEVEITHDPHNYPAASTAYRHKAHWIVSQIFGNRILVLHRNATKPKDRVIGAVHEKENET